MRKIIILLLFCFIFENSYSDEQNRTIKPYHKEVLIDCRDCHGRIDKKDFKPVKTPVCLECHKSKQSLAEKLDFLKDKNPHNSIHDGLNLNCYSCHSEHKPSYNMCKDCHNTSTWMRDIK